MSESDDTAATVVSDTARTAVVTTAPAPDRGVAPLLADQGTIALLSAVVAWSITVAPAAFSRGGSAGAQVTAVLALAAGCAGPLVRANRRRLGRHLGISLFLAACVGTWLLAPTALSPSRLDPIRGAIGAIAWGAFALSQRERFDRRADAKEPDPLAPALAARGRLPSMAVPVAVIGVVASLAVLLLAWRVRDADRALLAQAVATGAAVALLSASAIVATSRGKRAGTSGRRLTSAAVRPLALLVVTALLGAIALALR